MEKLECSTIKCSQCGYVIEGWGILSCPRCNASLLDQVKCNGDCRNCKTKIGK